MNFEVSIQEHFILELKTVYPGSIFEKYKSVPPKTFLMDHNACTIFIARKSATRMLYLPYFDNYTQRHLSLKKHLKQGGSRKIDIDGAISK